MRADEARKETVALIKVWPAEEWISEADLAVALHETGDVHRNPNGDLHYRGRLLRSLLNEARRRSMLLRDQRREPTVYKRPVAGFSSRGDQR